MIPSILILFSFITFFNPPLSENRTWDGGGIDNNWSTPENWDNNLVPETDADVFIDSAYEVFYDILTDTVESVTMKGGARLIILENTELHTTKGGPIGSDGFRLEGDSLHETRLVVNGTLDIQMNGASGDGLDITKYSSLLVNSTGTVNISNTGDDGIETDDDITNNGVISIFNTNANGINFGSIVPGDAIIHNQNGALLSIHQTGNNGIKLNSHLSLINEGSVSISECPSKLFEGNDGDFFNFGVFKGDGLIDADNFIHENGSIISPGVSIGVLSFDEGTSFLNSAINFTIENIQPATGFDQLIIETGSVLLTNTNLVIDGNYIPAESDSFVIMKLANNFPVIGTFNGLPEGAMINLNGKVMYISYTGGDGNDVVLSSDNSVSTKEATLATSLKIYPTLVSDKLWLEINNRQVNNPKIMISNATGKVIIDQVKFNNQNKFVISTAAWASGQYFVTLISDIEVITFPFSKVE